MTQPKTHTLIFLVLIITTIATSTIAESQSEPPLEETCGNKLNKLAPNKNTPPVVNVQITPVQRNVGFFTQRNPTFLICIANNSNTTLNGYIYVWHSGDNENMMHIIGPHFIFPNDNKVGMRQIDVLQKDMGSEGIEDGRGLGSYEDGLQPGDIAQYTVMANISNFSNTGRYIIRIKYIIWNKEEPKYRPLSQDSATLTVTCSPWCFLRRYPEVVLGLTAILISIIGIIFSSERARGGVVNGLKRVHEKVCMEE